MIIGLGSVCYLHVRRKLQQGMVPLGEESDREMLDLAQNGRGIASR
jgi:hypothetical protein